MNELLLSFYGDDFTGSTDAMESLALAGVRTVLFTRPPTQAELNRYNGLRAFGVAGTTRSMKPDAIERELRPAFEAIRELRPPIVHYKVCSTFDSSPAVGSIGRAIDVGADVFGTRAIPVVVGAPALGRYCAFGNLFARLGGDGEVFRLDRHPSMCRHPVTPMDEADLRVHLAKQTSKSIGLVDVRVLDGARPEHEFDRMAAANPVVVIDLISEAQLPVVGRLVTRHAASSGGPCFVVGSSGIESALVAHWGLTPATFAPVAPAKALLVVSGSCSPVTAAQMQHAAAHGFVDVPVGQESAVRDSANALRAGRSVVLHSRDTSPSDEIGPRLGRAARELLAETGIRRVLVAGGDTSGRVADILGISSLEMVGVLTRGAPLCRASAPQSPADGIEVVFKGGQIGTVDFISLVKNGSDHG